MSHDGSVVGIAAGGVALWLDGQPQPTSFKLSEVASVSLSSDRALLAMGTRAGRVALVRTNGSPAERMNPPRVDGHDHPVLSIAFSRKGKWLATLADRCRLWAY